MEQRLGTSPKMSIRGCLIGLVVLSGLTTPLVGCTRSGSQTSTIALEHEVVAKGLDHPWSLAFLPDGRMLVSERRGRLRYVNGNGALSQPLGGVPSVFAKGQGGLFDVALDPAFGENTLIYLAYSEPLGGGESRTVVGRGRLEAQSIRDFEVIFRQTPSVDSRIHFGGRLVFDRGGSLYITLGERGERDEAQNRNNQLGSIVRIKRSGGIPPDNPFAAEGSPLYSFGNRNPQGAALHPETGELWVHEHGPQGGDEVNIIRPGLNYGWPVVTHGAEYGTGIKIGEGVSKPTMEDPLHIWVPSIAPSGMAFYTGKRYPGWEGSLFVGALRGRLMVRLILSENTVIAEERYTFDPSARIRDVRQGPDGYLYLLTDEDEGEIRRIVPR